MIPYHTAIDTIAFQINCGRDNLTQNDILQDYKDYLKRVFNAYVDPVEYSNGYDTAIEHKVYCNNRIVLSFKTGYSNGNFYLKIVIAGLSTYDYAVDKTSDEYLWATVAYLNSNHIKFNMAELDIAIDVPHAHFEHLLAICTTKTSGTQYYSLLEQQLYTNETHYVERFESKAAMDEATKRAYFYNKRIKELNTHNYDIGYELQRFELKLQSDFFKENGLDMAAIEEALNKYHFLYFEDLYDKYNIIDRYCSYSKVTPREIRRMGLNQFRLYPNLEYINNFLFYIQNTRFDDLNKQ